MFLVFGTTKLNIVLEVRQTRSATYLLCDPVQVSPYYFLCELEQVIHPPAL